MKKILTTQIEANVRGLRFPRSSFNHLMNAYTEGFQAMLETLNCDPDDVTILTGAVVDGSADPDFTVQAGWAAYQNEIFQIDAGAFTAGGGQTAVWVIETTYLASDPVKFDDGNEFNVNQIRKLKLQSGVAESGVKDWNEVKYLGRFVENGGNTGTHTIFKTKTIEIGDWDMTDILTPTKSVAHSIESGMSKIRQVYASIRPDSDAAFPANCKDLISPINDEIGISMAGYSEPQGAISWNDGFVFLWRAAGSGTLWYENDRFNETPYNRGWITIVYEE